MKGNPVELTGQERIFDGEGNPLNEIAAEPNIDKVFTAPRLNRHDAKKVVKRFRSERMNWKAKKNKEAKKKEKRKSKKGKK